MQSISKDSDSIRAYGFDWALNVADGAVLTNSSWTVTGPDVALSLSGQEFNGTITKCTMLGGTGNKQYTVTNRVVIDGETLDYSFDVMVRPK